MTIYASQSYEQLTTHINPQDWVQWYSQFNAPNGYQPNSLAAIQQNLLWQNQSTQMFQGNPYTVPTTLDPNNYTLPPHYANPRLNSLFQKYPGFGKFYQSLFGNSLAQYLKSLWAKMFGAKQAIQPPTPQVPNLPPPQFTLSVKAGEGNEQIIETPGYEIVAEGEKSAWYIRNKETGERIRSWGDPHFQSQGADGKTVKKGKDWTAKTMTFILDDGTKITAHAKSATGVTTHFNVYTPDGKYVEVKEVNSKNPTAQLIQNGGLDKEAQELDGDVVAVGGGGNSLYEVDKDLDGNGVIGNKYFGEDSDADKEENNFFQGALGTVPGVDYTAGVANQWFQIVQLLHQYFPYAE